MPDGQDAVHLQQQQDLLQETLGRYEEKKRMYTLHFKLAHKKTAKARYASVHASKQKTNFCYSYFVISFFYTSDSCFYAKS